MKNLPDLAFVNGKPGNDLVVSDRGLAYGDGLFETMLLVDGKPVLADLHLQRLCRDSRRMQIRLDTSTITSEFDRFLKCVPAKTGIVKITVTRQTSGRGYGFDSKNSDANRVLQFYSGLSYPRENTGGVRLSLADCRLADNRLLAGIKHLNRLDQVFAHQAIRKPFYQEALVFGAHGEVVEGTVSNLFLVKGEELVTPDLHKAGVAGVMRDYILLQVAANLKLKTLVCPVSLDDVLCADELFVCNSVFGLWPVNAIHVREFTVGKTTLAIQKQVNALGYPAIYQ